MMLMHVPIEGTRNFATLCFHEFKRRFKISSSDVRTSRETTLFGSVWS